MPTDRVTPLPTGPAYISPSEAGAQQFTPSQALQTPPKKGRGKLLLAILLVLLLFGGLASVAAIVAVKKARDIARKVIIKQTTEVPKAPQQPAPPGLPSPPPAAGTTTVDSALVYPGAQTVVDVDNGAEGHVIQLKSSDPPNKVTDWYVKNLKPSKVVHIPVTDSGSILRTDRGTIVITPSDEGTQIIIKQGGEPD